MYKLKHVSKLEDIPKEPHYVIVEMNSVFIPGDERSRTHPGHGYPERTEHYTSMWVTTSREDWEEEIKERCERDLKEKEKFIAYHVDHIASVWLSVEVI